MNYILRVGPKGSSLLQELPTKVLEEPTRPYDNLVDEIINKHNLQQQNDSEQNSSHANGGG